jgi:hypothetical protein
MTIQEAREALTDKISEIESRIGDYIDHGKIPTVTAEIFALEASVRSEERMSERLRMHRMIDFAIIEAEKINANCVAGLKVAKSLVEP